MAMTPRPLKIALGDLSYLNAENRMNLYVPLNIAYLAAYAKRKFGAAVDIRLFKDPVKMLEHVRTEKPDLVGLSLYYWNNNLNALMVRKIREACEAKIVLGGPSVDSDPEEQQNLLARFPGVDWLVQNEGEDGFAQIIAHLLGGPPPRFSLGLSADLADIPSPYLDGTLDEFLNGNYQPMIQTSRVCPYTCAFCVSGKNRGKLRAFPVEQVKAEIDYVAQRFRDHPDMLLYLVDDNFGILERDLEVADHLLQAQASHGYPQKIFYYNDKRFTDISRQLQERLGHMCHHGVMLSLQSENPETLKAIRRKNLTDEQIASALDWARGLGIKTSTELIFGLPMETRDSFLALLDKSARLGFDAIQCYNLIIFDGIEMNRAKYRKEHDVRTRRRLIHGCRQVIEGERVIESEEVVASSRSFSFADYKLIRKLNVLFHAIFIHGWNRDYFSQAVAAGESLTGLLQTFLTTCREPGWSEFMRDLDAAIESDLFDLGDEPPASALKIQPVFARRLADMGIRISA